MRSRERLPLAAESLAAGPTAAPAARPDAAGLDTTADTPRGGAFRSLRVPAFRLWFAASLVSNTGTWMQRVAQDWLVLTGLTHDSATAVGVTTGLQFGPVLLVGPWAGSLADRYDRRTILLITQSVMGLLGAVTGLLVLTGEMRLWMLYVLAGLTGIASAVDGPARQTFVSALVPEKLLANAVSLNGFSFHSGRLVGPAVAGVLMGAVGVGPVFLVNAVSYLAAIGALLLMPARSRAAASIAGAARLGVLSGLREALAYLRTRPDLVLLFAVVGIVSAFALNFQLTTAVMARVAFGRGAGEYGLLGSVMAIGAVSGSLAAAARRRPSLTIVHWAVWGLGVSSALACLMPSYLTFAVMLVPCGFSALSLMTTCNAMIQMGAEPAMRGRVMAVYSIVFMGSTPVGSPLIGWLGDTFGPRWTIGIGAVACVVVALALHVVRSRAGRARPGTSSPDAAPAQAPAVTAG